LADKVKIEGTKCFVEMAIKWLKRVDDEKNDTIYEEMDVLIKKTLEDTRGAKVK